MKFNDSQNSFQESIASNETEQVYKPIWEVAQELRADVPPEVIARLPTDGAVQHDHYIYSTPKTFPC